MVRETSAVGRIKAVGSTDVVLVGTVETFRDLFEVTIEFRFGIEVLQAGDFAMGDGVSVELA